MELPPSSDATLQWQRERLESMPIYTQTQLTAAVAAACNERDRRIVELEGLLRRAELYLYPVQEVSEKEDLVRKISAALGKK